MSFPVCIVHVPAALIDLLCFSCLATERHSVFLVISQLIAIVFVALTICNSDTFLLHGIEHSLY